MAGGAASQAFVEPSRSVKTKVRVPSGSPPIGMTVLHAECYLLSVPLKVPKDVEELAKEVERCALRLQDVERIRPAVQRSMKEENEQQAAAAAVVEPGRNDGERDRAHHEQAKR